MSKHHTINENLHDLVDDTRALLAATADAAGEKVRASRKRLADALDAAGDACVLVKKRAVAQVDAADQMVRENPYRVAGIAAGIGLVLGFLLARRR